MTGVSESVLVYDGIPVFGSPHGFFFSKISTVSSHFTAILG